jgi:hypothetical protein
MVEFHVVGLSGLVCTLSADQVLSVGEAKAAIEEFTGIPHWEQRLLVGAVELEGELLGRVCDGTDITMIRRPPGQAAYLRTAARDGWQLRNMPSAMRADREVVLAAVQSLGTALQYAAKELRSDREVVVTAVRSQGSALYWAAREFRSDRDVVLAAVRSQGEALQYAAAEYKADRDVVLAAVSSRGFALGYAAAELRRDRQITLTAVTCGLPLERVDETLRGDPEIIRAAEEAQWSPTRRVPRSHVVGPPPRRSSWGG